VALNACVYLSITIRRAAAWNQVVCRGQLNCDNTRTEKRFRLSAKRTSPFKRQGRQFSRLLADEVGAPAVVMVVMLDTPCSEVVGRALATHSIRQFTLYSPPVRHLVPSHFNWSLPSLLLRDPTTNYGGCYF